MLYYVLVPLILKISLRSIRRVFGRNIEYNESRLVHSLDVQDKSEESQRQQSYAIKNELGQTTPYKGYFACSSLVLYGIRVPIIEHFRAWKPTIPSRGLWLRRAGSLWHKIAGASITRECGTSTNESGPVCESHKYLTE